MVLIFLLLGLAAALGAEAGSPFAARPDTPGAGLPPNLDPVAAGQELAAQLRLMIPAESTRYTGALKTREPETKKNTTVPVMVTSQVKEPSWQVVYETGPKAPVTPERLTILHAPGQLNVYLYGAGATLNQPARLAGDQANRSFAGSVFWLADLGLEFFHWPEQRLIKYEMRHSRSCRVLESRPARVSPGGYARVLSWVDVETSGLVSAEAYDAHTKLLKEFKVDSLVKVEGKYQLKGMRIRNVQTKAVTELVYDQEGR
jgi:hypothetical protein